MKISELRAFLERTQNEVGDIEVLIAGDPEGNDFLRLSAEHLAPERVRLQGPRQELVVFGEPPPDSPGTPLHAVVLYPFTTLYPFDSF